MFLTLISLSASSYSERENMHKHFWNFLNSKWIRFDHFWHVIYNLRTKESRRMFCGLAFIQWLNPNIFYFFTEASALVRLLLAMALSSINRSSPFFTDHVCLLPSTLWHFSAWNIWMVLGQRIYRVMGFQPIYKIRSWWQQHEYHHNRSTWRQPESIKTE